MLLSFLFFFFLRSLLFFLFFFFFFLMIRRPPRSTLFLHDALPISTATSRALRHFSRGRRAKQHPATQATRSSIRSWRRWLTIPLGSAAGCAGISKNTE